MKTRTRPTRPRPSFLSRVVHRVVPCVSPAPDSPHEADDTSPEPSSLALREMTGVQLPERDAQPMDSDNQAKTSQEVAPIAPLVNPPIVVFPPPSSTDSDIIVPPPPSTHLLPEDETDGLTSGAVQPPGSTGEIVRTHTRDSSEDSDRTSVTDDDGDNHMLDEQAEEDRLIRNGGSGIPIGLVRFIIHWRETPLIVLMIVGWSTKTAIATHFP